MAYTRTGILLGKERKKESRVKREREEGEGIAEKKRARQKLVPARDLRPGGAENINPRFVEIESRLIGARVELTAREQIMSLGPTLY